MSNRLFQSSLPPLDAQTATWIISGHHYFLLSTLQVQHKESPHWRGPWFHVKAWKSRISVRPRHSSLQLRQLVWDFWSTTNFHIHLHFLFFTHFYNLAVSFPLWILLSFTSPVSLRANPKLWMFPSFAHSHLPSFTCSRPSSPLSVIFSLHWVQFLFFFFSACAFVLVRANLSPEGVYGAYPLPFYVFRDLSGNKFRDPFLPLSISSLKKLTYM